MKTSRTVVGVDTAKRVFQLHWVDMETGEIVDLKLTRAKFLEHFVNRAPCLVAMEACGGPQHWARQLLVHLMSRLYERTSIVITTNPSPARWPTRPAARSSRCCTSVSPS